MDTKLAKSNSKNKLNGLKDHHLATYSWMRKYVIGVNVIKFFAAVFSMFLMGGILLSSSRAATTSGLTAVAISFGLALYFYHVAIQGALTHDGCYILTNGVLVLLANVALFSQAVAAVPVSGIEYRDLLWLRDYYAIVGIPATILAIEVFCCVRMYAFLLSMDSKATDASESNVFKF